MCKDLSFAEEVCVAAVQKGQDPQVLSFRHKGWPAHVWSLHDWVQPSLMSRRAERGLDVDDAPRRGTDGNGGGARVIDAPKEGQRRELRAHEGHVSGTLLLSLTVGGGHEPHTVRTREHHCLVSVLLQESRLACRDVTAVRYLRGALRLAFSHKIRIRVWTRAATHDLILARGDGLRVAHGHAAGLQHRGFGPPGAHRRPPVERGRAALSGQGHLLLSHAH